MAVVLYAEKSKHLLVHATQEARSLGHSYVGTAHLLLAMCSQNHTPAGEILRESGLQPELVRAWAVALYGAGAPGLRLPRV